MSDEQLKELARQTLEYIETTRTFLNSPRGSDKRTVAREHSRDLGKALVFKCQQILAPGTLDYDA
jgi:hypothetical protein